MGRASSGRISLGLPPLRQYWQEVNRAEREAVAELRARRKSQDKQRAKCRCEAYPWPHRPGGGLCRFPDPPAERWQPKQPWKYRPHQSRYAGLRRQIARASHLHPIRDRETIDKLMPYVIARAKELKRQCPRIKYRNMEIVGADVTDSKVTFTLRGLWSTVGPEM